MATYYIQAMRSCSYLHKYLYYVATIATAIAIELYLYLYANATRRNSFRRKSH